jgi:hypothetical protein
MVLASAFDLTLDGEIEAKFSALKNLQAKKIKLIAKAKKKLKVRFGDC